MKLRKFTKRKSPLTGKPYPQCQVISGGKQCEKPVYEEGLCWGHYTAEAKSKGKKIESLEFTVQS